MTLREPGFISSGVVTEDPVTALEVGSRLHFAPVAIKLNLATPTGVLEQWEFFEGMLLSISFTEGETHRVEGSAVLVAPGVAICATHVIEPKIASLMASTANAICQGITSNGLQLWGIRKVTILPGCDFTILGLVLASALPPDNLFHQAAITTRTPSVGERLVICGFRASEPAFSVRQGAKTKVTGHIRLSEGPVSERYLCGRDKVMIPWPVLEVRCSTVGGMSGGPVFDSNGLLVGLLFSSIETEDGEGISYVSMIWRALTTNFETAWLPSLVGNPVSLLSMDRRLCSIDKPDAVRSIPHACGSGFQIEYQPWEQ